jgi:excisionase family DNA binding protein
MRQMTSEAPMETMLTIRQVADFLHVSISTVRRWSDGGMVKSYRVGPRGDRRYRRGDVLSFLKESTRRRKTGAVQEKTVRTTEGSENETRILGDEAGYGQE